MVHKRDPKKLVKYLFVAWKHKVVEVSIGTIFSFLNIPFQKYTSTLCSLFSRNCDFDGSEIVDDMLLYIFFCSCLLGTNIIQLRGVP